MLAWDTVGASMPSLRRDAEHLQTELSDVRERACSRAARGAVADGIPDSAQDDEAPNRSGCGAALPKIGSTGCGDACLVRLPRSYKGLIASLATWPRQASA